jgi:two-component system cell cycle sensor histidine kinase/response regulator CckA
MNSHVQAEVAALRQLPASASAPCYRVLLVEDNPGDADLARELLSRSPGMPLRLEVAVSLAQAERCLKAGAFEAILTDLNLPDAQGLGTLSRLRRLAPDVPIIVLTGVEDEALRQRALAEGAEEVFTKREANSRLFCRSVLYEVERNRARAQHRRLEGLLDATPDAILVVNRAGEVQYVNQAAIALFGRPREELRGESLAFSATSGEPVEIMVPRPGDPRVCEMRVVSLEWDGEPAHRGLHPRHHRAPPGRRPARAQRRAGAAERAHQQGHAAEEPVPGQHEPRDPHADERHHRAELPAGPDPAG